MDFRTTVIKVLLGEQIVETKEGGEDHWQTGHDFAADHAMDSGFKQTARARKSEMLKQNPHKKGTPEHKEWHEGALAGHQTGLDNM